VSALQRAAPARLSMSSRDVFQAVSYLQYPMLLVALGYAARSAIAMASAAGEGWSPAYGDWNYVLLYAGIGIGLSSLQDPRKAQNELSRKVWQDPRKGRWMLALIAAYAFGAMATGLAGAYLAGDTAVSQLSLGLLALGLGMLGLLKTAIEMREHHRLDIDPVVEPGAPEGEAA
jgi:Na+(H+)/acetate symporter ActP